MAPVGFPVYPALKRNKEFDGIHLIADSSYERNVTDLTESKAEFEEWDVDKRRLQRTVEYLRVLDLDAGAGIADIREGLSASGAQPDNGGGTSVQVSVVTYRFLYLILVGLLVFGIGVMANSNPNAWFGPLVTQTAHPATQTTP